MTKYKVEIRETINDCWDEDAIQDYIEAENMEEAVEFAKDYINEHNENAEKFMYRVTDTDRTEEQIF